MSSYAVTESQKRALAVATVLALVGGYYFLRSYLMLVIFAAIVAFIFNPLYKRLLAKGRKPGTAAGIVFFCSLLAFIIPVVLVLVVSAHQVLSLVHTITNGNYSTNLNDLLQKTVDYCNHILASWHISYRLTVDAVTNGLGHALKNFGQDVLNSLTSSLSGFFSFFTRAIIYVYIFLSLLTKQDKLLQTVHALNPLGKDISRMYMAKIAAMTKAMVRGQFIIAAAQGFTDASLLYIAGLHSTFFFFLMLLTLLSIIPLGGGIIAIPIGVIMLFTGNIWGGLLVIIGHLIIVTNIDNVLRPTLVPSQARLDPALTLLSVFAGLKFFGFLGIIVGPVLMILIITTIRVYMEVYQGIDADDGESRPRHKRHGIDKVMFWKHQANTEG